MDQSSVGTGDPELDELLEEQRQFLVSSSAERVPANRECSMHSYRRV